MSDERPGVQPSPDPGRDGGVGPAPQTDGVTAAALFDATGVSPGPTRSTARTPSRRRRSAEASARTPADELPVARIAIDLPLIHLDRPFDYLVPASMSAAAQPGVRVRVRLAGQKVDGFVLDRADGSAHDGRLAFIDSVVSPEPVLMPEVFALAREVADHYVGTVADVLRLAVPPRHARIEAEVPDADALAADLPRAVLDEGPPSADWAAFPEAPGFIGALRGGASPRAVLTVPPPVDWTALVVDASRATLASGRGVLVVVPDRRDAALLHEAFAGVVAPGSLVHLAADVGPAERYRRFLRISRGHAQVVIGTRSAAFAPVPDLGLAVVWDDGDDLHAEPRAPYPHVREVLAMRARTGTTGLLVAGRVRTAEGERLVRSGWAAPLVADRTAVRAEAPEVHAAADDIEAGRDPQARAAHLPSMALRALQGGVTRGPVLVQVPRAGYVPALRCQDCREVAACTACAGPLRLVERDGDPSCAWCGRDHVGWACPHCQGRRLRAGRTGARRTAEELGRAFPGVRVVTSGRDGVLDTVPSRPALVIATPGAEPIADGGYAAAALLDGDRLLDRPDLRASEEALRRWSNAVGLCRSRTDGGQIVIAADPSAPAVQALVRSDPDGFASREFEQRLQAHQPPAARVITLTGPVAEVGAFLDAVDRPDGTEVLGPIPVEGPRAARHQPSSEPGDEPPVPLVRVILRVPLALAADLTAAVRAVAVARSSAKQPFVTSVVDPLVLD
jgi:primosomal protein N' (replication factor Y)